MNSPLETLFVLLAPDQPSETEARAVKAAESAIRAAKQRLTPEEYENLWGALIDVGNAGCQDCFTRGFRLGVQLTLEGLRQL